MGKPFLFRNCRDTLLPTATELISLGIPESNAQAYEEVLQNGGVFGVVPRFDDDARTIKEDFVKQVAENIVYADFS